MKSDKNIPLIAGVGMFLSTLDSGIINIALIALILLGIKFILPGLPRNIAPGVS